MQHKFFAKLAGCILVLELASWLAYANIQLGTMFFYLALIFVLGLSIHKLEYGIYALVAELVVGSHGYMLSLDVADFTISLRLGLFLVVFIAWIIWISRQRAVYFFESPVWKWYVALLAFLVIGVVVGYIHGNTLHDIFFDWNGYLFFGMILPFTQAVRTKQHVYNLLCVLFAGVAVLAIKTLILVFLFSHSEYFVYYLGSIYKWIRDFRIGEITLQPNGFYRIFFQSHIYVVYALCISLALLLYRWRWEYIAAVSATITLLFLSYSRSFWLATLLIIALLAMYALWKRQVSVSRLTQVYGMAAIVFLVGYVCILGIINLPLSSDGGSGVSAGSLLTDRTQDPTTEAAGSSRMALLQPLLQKNLEHPLLGSGFGTNVTYRTQDPRALATNPDGYYTTFAFEWGYLDLWLKLGLAGTVVYLMLLGLLLLRAYSLAEILPKTTDRYIVIGLLFSTIALVVVHALTPYLNHPLGIGWIVIVTVIIDYYSRHTHELAAR